MSDTIATDLWKALLDAQRSVANVARGGTNSSQNYKFATAEDVMLEARSRLHERDLLLTFSESNHKIRETQRADKRTGEIIPGATVATVELDGCLIHAASGQQYTFSVSGEGADYGDKALPKAYTNAVKYGCRHLLLIPFGEDPEVDSPQRGQAAPARPAGDPNLATEKQAGMLYAKSKAAGMDDATLQKALAHTCGAQVKRCEQVPRSKVDDVVGMIELWAKKQQDAAS